MNKTLLLTMVLFLQLLPCAQAQDTGDKPRKHHKLWEWFSQASPDELAKFRAAKEQAMKDPAVQAAHERRKQADAEYRQLLDSQMLKADPSLKPLLDKVQELRKHDDF